MSPKCFEKYLSDEFFLHFSSKVQSLTVFSIICTVRIRFFGPGELFRGYFSGAQYSRERFSYWFFGSKERESVELDVGFAPPGFFSRECFDWYASGYGQIEHMVATPCVASCSHLV